MKEIYAYVAHSDGYLAGMVAGGIDKKFVAKSVSKFIRAGCSIKPCSSEEEYMRVVKELKPWSAREKDQPTP
jgi:hypothetical protein